MGADAAGEYRGRMSGDVTRADGRHSDRGHGTGGRKALIVTTVSGFVPQFEMNNVRILQGMGYEVHYASNFQNVSFGSDNHRLDGTGIVRHQVDFARSPFQLKENGRAYRQLEQLLKGQHFGLLHCHTPVGAALARLAARPYRKRGMKLIYTAHGFHFYKGAPLKYWLLFYPVERWLAGFTDVLITVNQEDYRRAKGFCRNKKTKVGRIAGIGIDTAYFAGEDLQEGGRQAIRRRVRERLHIGDNETLFLSVGELIPRKNHAAVIGALAEIERETGGRCCFRYIICGQGVLKEELKKQAGALGLSEKVGLLGYCENIRELLYAADVFVFPSVQEGMPVALMEAIAAGVPVIASDIRGNRELLGKQKGASAFRNGEELRNALRRVLIENTGVQGKAVRQDEADRQNGRKDARAVRQTGHRENAGSLAGSKLEEFDMKQVGRQMQNIYKELET